MYGVNNPHLVFLSSSNLGLCPRGGEKPLVYSRVVTLANTSNEDIYLIHSWLEPDYPTGYSKYGFIFYPYGFPDFFSPPIVIPAKNKREVSVWFFAHQTGDTIPIEFKSMVIIRSRTSPTFPAFFQELYADTLFCSATAIDSENILVDNITYHETRGCPSYYSKYAQSNTLQFYNNLRETVTLDSIHSDAFGNSIPKKISLSNTISADIKLPVDIYSKANISVSINFIPRPFGENNIAITGYFTNKVSQKKYIRTANLFTKDTLLPPARFYLYSSSVESKDGKQKINKQAVFLSSCSSESIWLDSLTFSNVWVKNELEISSGVITVPFLLDPNEEYKLDLTYNPQTHGRTFGFVQAYFHTTDGRQIVRTLDFQTYYPDASSVSETPDESTAKPSLLLTTPLLSTKLLGENIDSPQLYDSYGSKIDVSSRLTQGVLSFEGLSSGVYCLIFKTSVGMVIRKVLYVR